LFKPLIEIRDALHDVVLQDNLIKVLFHIDRLHELDELVRALQMKQIGVSDHKHKILILISNPLDPVVIEEIRLLAESFIDEILFDEIIYEIISQRRKCLVE